MKTGYLKKTIALCLCLVITFSFGACSLMTDIRYSFQNKISTQENIPVQELTRLIISSINDKKNTADAYSMIPTSQLDGLSYSYFYAYMDILRELSKQDNKGNVVSFRVIENDECQSILGQELFSKYGRTVGAELLYSSPSLYPVYIFFHEDMDGNVSLSSSWVTSIINIYNYGNHYFTMLEDGNADGVVTILSPGLTDMAYTSEAVYSRAMKLCEFYRIRVMSDRSDYEITRLVPGEMIVRIPETVADDAASFEDHIVTLTMLNNGNYHIDDSIHVELDQNLTYLMRGDERLIKVGADYSYSDLVSLMGNPSSLNADTVNGRVMVIYNGLVLRFDGEVASADSWTGKLTSVRILSNSAYTLGYYLYVGMNRTQLLVAYPFIDDSNYELSFINGTSLYDVTFTFDESGIVNNIKISV